MSIIHHLYNICCRDCCNFKRHHPSSEPVKCLSFLGFFIDKLILEVFGAAGAVWGSSDVFRLRDDVPIPNNSYTTNDLFRLTSLFVFTIFTIRFYWTTKHYLQHNHEYLPIKTEHRRSHRLACLQIYASRFVLQVLGGCGAIWGCSEAIALRNDDNTEQWRLIAASFGCMFMIRWLLQISSYCLIMDNVRNSCLGKVIDWFEILIAKLILEVFGAAGAIWGFSQIIMLRTEDTINFWRAASIATMIIFTLRWLVLLKEFVSLEREAYKDARRNSDTVTRDDLEKQDSEINDLALTETHTLSSRENSLPPPYQSTP